MFYPIWGREGIDQNTIDQMDCAANLPVAVGGALMPDAHLGYGIPIGGVLATEEVIIPYAVGVDIACRMRVSIFNIDPKELEHYQGHFSEVLEKGTYFGVGVTNPTEPDHPVLHEDWGVSLVTAEHKEMARKQLGTSGSGNHFAEWGSITNGRETMVALMTHSGSRGCGAKVCNLYSKVAKAMRPEYGELAWLDLDSDQGLEYWDSMQLMGRYATANHDVIHDTIAGLISAKPVAVVENHHNFAWKEMHNGREVIVHRKGATPAGRGVVGVIPGSMGTRSYIVEGLGNPDSLCSSSHGAGRVMSRKQAKKEFCYEDEVAALAEQGVTVLSAGADEVCGVYKDIRKVMRAQQDLVKIRETFIPKIVKMAPAKKRRWEK